MATTRSPNRSSEDLIDPIPFLGNSGGSSDEISTSRRFVRRQSLRQAARLLRQASSRRMMREPSMLVRETAAEQLEERQSDWAYSKPVIILDLVWNFAFVVVAASVLVLSGKESPSMPLRLWIIGYAVQCILHMVCVMIEYRRRRQARRGRYTPVHDGVGSGSNLSPSVANDSTQYVVLNQLEEEGTGSVAKHLESANTMFSFIWWIIGFYWVSAGGQSLADDSPQLYRISSSLSLYSRPKLVAGSAEGYSGHIDGRLREARMNHPKGLTVDDKGNIYVADTMNMAIRKISDSGVTTIAGGKWSRGGGHVDGPSEEAKFSDDFDVVYIGSSCSLLVVDRGNRAIREIQLHFDDCAYQYGSGFPLGIAMLCGAGFFGYMLALLQRRVGAIISSKTEHDPIAVGMPQSPYQKPMKSVRPPLIPAEDEQDRQEEGFFGSFGKLLANAGASTMEILGGVFPGFRKQSSNYRPQQLLQPPNHSWPAQESFVIPDEDDPPSIDTRTPTPRKTYAFMSKDPEKIHQLRQSRSFYSGWDGDARQPPHQPQQQHHQQQPLNKHTHNRHQYQSSTPHTYYEQSNEKTNEIVFGAVQEHSGKRNGVVIKPVNYADPVYDHHNIRSRFNSMGYSHY